MAVILPFKGIRYNTEKTYGLDALVAPPYDVVSTGQRDALVSREGHNIFSLELPVASCRSGPYAHAGDLFRQWLNTGVLVRDDEPAVYPYHITFSVNGARYCRKGLIALVRLEDWESRVVRPHEQTFNQVTEDRLRLLEATHAQFSQVFMLYRGNEAANQVLSGAPSTQLCSVTDPLGNEHRLYRITNRESLAQLHNALKDAVLYIADGHHRYTTALNFRRRMAKLHGDDPSGGYHYLMTYLVDTGDPGLVVLPTHRVVRLPSGMDFAGLMKVADEFFDVEALSLPTGPDNARAFADGMRKALDSSPGRQGIGVAGSGNADAYIWWMREEVPARVREMLQGLPMAVSQLDVELLERIVIRGLLGLDPDNAVHGKAIRYESDGARALEMLTGNDVLFFLRPTPVQQVIDVADAGLTMPHKSTFFYPKILTGMVINSVDNSVKLP